MKLYYGCIEKTDVNWSARDCGWNSWKDILCHEFICAAEQMSTMTYVLENAGFACKEIIFRFCVVCFIRLFMDGVKPVNISCLPFLGFYFHGTT